MTFSHPRLLTLFSSFRPLSPPSPSLWPSDGVTTIYCPLYCYSQVLCLHYYVFLSLFSFSLSVFLFSPPFHVSPLLFFLLFIVSSRFSVPVSLTTCLYFLPSSPPVSLRCSLVFLFFRLFLLFLFSLLSTNLFFSKIAPNTSLSLLSPLSFF